MKKKSSEFVGLRKNYFGHEVICGEPDDKYGIDNFRYTDNGKSIYEEPRPCPKCGEFRTEDGHDPCIKNLPGVKFACCGHGKKDGYIYFENGIVVNGDFKVSKSKN